MTVIERSHKKAPVSLSKTGMPLPDGAPTLATVVRADLEHIERYCPAYQEWLESRRQLAVG